MFAKCPAVRPGTADKVADVAELLMSGKGAFISGTTFLIDGGATASCFRGPLKPKEYQEEDGKAPRRLVRGLASACQKNKYTLAFRTNPH